MRTGLKRYLEASAVTGWILVALIAVIAFIVWGNPLFILIAIASAIAATVAWDFRL